MKRITNKRLLMPIGSVKRGECMKDKKGDMIMLDNGSVEADILATLGYTPYVFDGGKRVIFLVDKRGLKLFKKCKKTIERNKIGND